MKLTYLGHSAFYIESGSFKALIDPFIFGNPASPVKLEDFTDLTHIFVTHGHGDHLGDAVPLAEKTGALIITNYEISLYLAKFQVNVHPMHIGGRVKLDFGSVKMTPALHGSAISTENGLICGGNPGGFLIEVGGKKVYHAGDTGLTMDMQLLLCEGVDVALLPIGGNFTMDAVDAARAVEFIGPKISIPMHYNTFPVIETDPEYFKEIAPGEVHILGIGESYEF